MAATSRQRTYIFTKEEGCALQTGDRVYYFPDDPPYASLPKAGVYWILANNSGWILIGRDIQEGEYWVSYSHLEQEPFPLNS